MITSVDELSLARPTTAVLTLDASVEYALPLLAMSIDFEVFTAVIVTVTLPARKEGEAVPLWILLIDGKN